MRYLDSPSRRHLMAEKLEITLAVPAFVLELVNYAAQLECLPRSASYCRAMLLAALTASDHILQRLEL